MKWAIGILLLLTAISFWGNPKVDVRGKLRLFDVRVVDLINPLKWLSFIRGTLLKLLFPPHVIKQVFIRMNECPECVKDGKCIVCGCDTMGKMFDPYATCSLDRWGPNDSKERFEEREEKFKIKFNISYGK
jgi:hypothetical protein